MSFNDHSINELLADESFVRYILFPTREDQQYWTSYLHENPDKASTIKEARRILILLHESLREKDLEEQLAELKQFIKQHRQSEVELTQYNSNKRHISFFMARRAILYAATAAAVVIIVLGAAWLLRQKHVAPNANPVAQVPVSYHTYVCALGGRKTISLADGTHIILNSNSTLKVPDNFNQKTREVLLDGTAFFDIKHLAQKPFTVKARNLMAIDIGTSFLVRAYDYETDIQVLLLSGKVRVKTHSTNGSKTWGNSIELNPGQKLTLNKLSDQLQTEPFDTHKLETWETGRLDFNNASLKEVMEKLQNWYGVGFEIKGNQHRLPHFTGQFDQQQLDNVLKVISFSMNCHYKMEGNKVILWFK